MSRHVDEMRASSGTHTWLVLWKAFNAVRDYATRDIASLGLSLTDFGILEALLHKGSMAVNDLGKKVSLTSGSITTAVDRLQDRGLVREIKAAFRKHAAAMDQLGSVLTPEERAELVRLLKVLGQAAKPSST
jgi:MarR family transcriptional regulator, 2-MHQ and catechol-resistance regulon repressor